MLDEFFVARSEHKRRHIVVFETRQGGGCRRLSFIVAGMLVSILVGVTASSARVLYDLTGAPQAHLILVRVKAFHVQRHLGSSTSSQSVVDWLWLTS